MQLIFGFAQDSAAVPALQAQLFAAVVSRHINLGIRLLFDWLSNLLGVVVIPVRSLGYS